MIADRVYRPRMIDTAVLRLVVTALWCYEEAQRYVGA